MPCYTQVRVSIEDSALNRKARRNLNLPETGEIERGYVPLIKREVAVLRAIKETRRLAPDAVIKRNGFELSVQVSV